MSADLKMETSYIVIKGRFKATASSSYGLFIVFLDNLSKNVEHHDTVASHFSTIYENNIGMPWNEMEDIITRLKWKGEFATSLTHDIQASIEDLFQPGTGRTQDIWTNIKKAQINKVVSIFEEVLGRPTTDKAVKCEISIESVTKAEIEDVKRSRMERDGKEMLSVGQTDNAPAAPKPAEAGLDQSAVVLEVSLILSPVSGIPIYELKEGDKILIKITEQSNRGQYFIDLLNASVNNEIVPVPATVVKSTKEGKIYTVLVNIGPGIYGKSLDEDTVKIKRYDPAQDPRKKKQETQVPEITLSASGTPNPMAQLKKESNLNMLFLIIAGAAVFLIAILIFLFMG